MNATAQDRLHHFQHLVQEWGATKSDAHRANKLFGQVYGLAAELKTSPQGRIELESLLDHPSRACVSSKAPSVLSGLPESTRPALGSVVRPRRHLLAERRNNAPRVGSRHFDLRLASPTSLTNCHPLDLERRRPGPGVA